MASCTAVDGEGLRGIPSGIGEGQTGGRERDLRTHARCDCDT